MPYELVWTERALDSAAGYLADDPSGLTQLLAALDRLPDEPRPESSTAYGSNASAASTSAPYRALYEITGSTITLVHIGRTS